LVRGEGSSERSQGKRKELPDSYLLHGQRVEKKKGRTLLSSCSSMEGRGPLCRGKKNLTSLFRQGGDSLFQKRISPLFFPRKEIGALYLLMGEEPKLLLRKGADYYLQKGKTEKELTSIPLPSWGGKGRAAYR